MNISFSNVVPIPMIDSVVQSDIWLQQCTCVTGNAYQIVAPSGTGKTSLLHILFGIRSDYTGTVGFNDVSIQTLSHKQWNNYRTRIISIVFQGLRLFPELDIMDNIQIKNKRTNHKTQSQIKEMLDAVGMIPHMQKKAGILSYGQQQRVAVVRALCQPFEVLLLDEPFSHLDTVNAHTAFECVMHEVGQQKATLLLTSLELLTFNIPMHVYHL